MTSLINNSLIEECRSLNAAIEQNYLLLALSLVEIEEQELFKGAGYDTFQDFWSQDLGREKSTVSRLLAAGRWIKENGMQGKLPGATSYKKLVLAIKAFPTKDSDYVLSVAKTWSFSDFKESHVEEVCGTEGEHVLGDMRFTPCKKCGKFIRV